MSFTTYSTAVSGTTTTNLVLGSVLDPNPCDSSIEKQGVHDSTVVKKDRTGGNFTKEKSVNDRLATVHAMFGGKLIRQSVPGIGIWGAVTRRLFPWYLRDDIVSSRDFLLSIGMVENDTTKQLFRYADNPFIPGLSVQHLAKRLIMDILKPSDYSEYLDFIQDDGEDYVFQNGITARYFAPSFNTENSNYPKLSDEEKATLGRSIETYFGPVLPNHIRLYHGTSAGSVENTMRNGIDKKVFDKSSDFNKGFYCTPSMSNAINYGISRALSNEYQGIRGCIIAFDVDTAPNSEYDKKQKYPPGGQTWNMDLWTRIVTSNLSISYGDNFDASWFENADVVIGPISDQTVSILGDTQIRPYEPHVMQYVFRGDSGNLLMQDPTKVKVAVYDVEDPDFDPQASLDY